MSPKPASHRFFQVELLLIPRLHHSLYSGWIFTNWQIRLRGILIAALDLLLVFVGCGVSHGKPSFCKAVLRASRMRRCMKGDRRMRCLRSEKAIVNALEVKSCLKTLRRYFEIVQNTLRFR